MAKTLDQGSGAYASAHRIPNGIRPYALVAFGLLDQYNEEAVHCTDGNLNVAGNAVIAGTLLATGGGISTVTNYTADGAITIKSGVHTIAKTSAAAMTVAAPSSQDGTKMTIITNTDFAHVITFTGATLLDGTTGANTTVTMTAFKGSSIVVIAVGTKWLLETSSNVTSIV